MTIKLGSGAPRELGYAEITSNFVQTGAGTSDVTGLSVTVTVGHPEPRGSAWEHSATSGAHPGTAASQPTSCSPTNRKGRHGNQNPTSRLRDSVHA